MAFIAAALLASCSDDKDYSGDFGQIKVPDTRQLEQTVSADDTQSARGVTFTTEGAWTSTIAETRAEAPAWISISPDRGDAAGSYTLKITLEPNTSGASRTATIVITCGTSKIEITVTQEGADDPIESNIRITAIPRENMAEICVSDNGPGIPNELKERVFEMFFTGGNPIGDSRRSLGLGLTLCQTIVHAHHGEMTLKDNSPHGCIFSFTIPLSEVNLNE